MADLATVFPRAKRLPRVESTAFEGLWAPAGCRRAVVKRTCDLHADTAPLQPTANPWPRFRALCLQHASHRLVWWFPPQCFYSRLGHVFEPVTERRRLLESRVGPLPFRDRGRGERLYRIKPRGVHAYELRSMKGEDDDGHFIQGRRDDVRALRGDSKRRCAFGSGGRRSGGGPSGGHRHHQRDSIRTGCRAGDFASRVCCSPSGVLARGR